MEVTESNKGLVGYKNLIVYREAHKLVLCVYQFTKAFPKDELFGLIGQIRRCAISVVANIVEGYARRTKKEKLNFLYIARGSLTELEYYIDLSIELGYISKEQFKELADSRLKVGKLLYGLTRSVEK